MPAAEAPACRGARRALLAAGLAAAVLAAPGAAPAGESLAGTELDRFGDWVLLRAAPGVCQLRHTLLSATSGAVLLEMLLLPPDPAHTDGGALVALRVPLGVSLPDGIAWRHPASPTEAVGLAWQHCDATLCLAAGRISAAELDRLRRGNHVEVGFRPLPDAAPIRMQVSLRGVTAGWQALTDCAAAP